MDQLKQQQITLEPVSSVSGAGDSSQQSRFQSAARAYAKNSHTDSTNISYNMPTTATGTETSDSGYQNNVCIHHAQPNRSGLAACFEQQMYKSKGFRAIPATTNKLSVMMLMPGIAAAEIDRSELYHAAASNIATESSISGFRLRKRSNSFTQGQTTANFLSEFEIDNEHIHHHHQLLYQQPFIFNNEIAQRTLNYNKQRRAQQSTNLEQTNDQERQRMDRQISEKSNQQNSENSDNVQNNSELNNQQINQCNRPSKGTKVNFDLSTNRQSDNDDEVVIKELNSINSNDNDDMAAELASQCSVQMVITSREQDEESQI